MSIAPSVLALNEGRGYRVERVSDSVLLGYARNETERVSLASELGLAAADVEFNLDDFKAVELGHVAATYAERFIEPTTATINGVSRTFYPYADWVLMLLLERQAATTFPILFHLTDGTKLTATPTAAEVTSLLLAVRTHLRAATDTYSAGAGAVAATPAPGIPTTLTEPTIYP